MGHGYGHCHGYDITAKENTARSAERKGAWSEVHEKSRMCFPQFPSKGVSWDAPHSPAVSCDNTGK